MNRVVMAKTMLSIHDVLHVNNDVQWPGEAWITWGEDAGTSGWIDTDEIVKAICHGWLA
jgi:hypothetical protein